MPWLGAKRRRLSHELAAEHQRESVEQGRTPATLAQRVGGIASILLRDDATPEDAYRSVTDELLDLLVPPDETGRATVWRVDPTSGAFRLSATSARGGGETAAADLAPAAADEELAGLTSLAFLQSLVRRHAGHDGLFRTGEEIKSDMAVPNVSGYDQVMYAACVHLGVTFAVVGVGRKMNGARDEERDCGWEAPHACAVNCVADLLRMPYLHAPEVTKAGEDIDRDCDLDFFTTTITETGTTRLTLTEETCQGKAFERTSGILGIAADRLKSYGLLGMSAWDYDDGALILKPGRRTRPSAGSADFSETPIDWCESITEGVTRIARPLARKDYINLDWGGAKFEADEMAELREFMTQDLQDFNQGSDKSRDVKLMGCKHPVKVASKFATQISGLGADVVSSDRSDDRIILMPVMARGALRFILSFTLDGEAAKNEENVAAVLWHGLQARKKLLAMYWEYRILWSAIAVPDMSNLISEIRTGNAVALTGAGFSLPAGLMSWADLLSALLESARDTSSVDNEQYDYIEGLIAERTADAFDEAAQSLEDVLGEERMQNEIGALLAIDFDSMPRMMQRRARFFMDIPWRAVLTTNYDMCLSGRTPQCLDVGESYVRALRTGVASIGHHLIGSAPDTPVIKLHGCVQRGNIVFTRSGYRKLLYRASGYRVFLQSMMASHTLVSLGHSGTDAYLNELNSELLTMFGKSDLPLRYSIAPASEGMATFARRYDGLNFLSWDKELYGWGVFDFLLHKLRRSTSPRAQMFDMLRGRRILLVESANADPVGWKLIELASTLFNILPSATVHLLDSPDNLQAVVAHAVENVAPYDIVFVVYDESTQTVLDQNRLATFDHNLPIAVVESSCSCTSRGIAAALKGCIRVVGSKADAAEFLFKSFEQDRKHRH